MGHEIDQASPPVEVVKGSISRLLHDLQHAKSEEARARARNELWVRGWNVARSFARRGFLDHPDEDSIQDAANIAFVTFADGAKEGEFPALTCRQHFFRVLATIAHRTALNLRRAQGAQKRGGKATFSPSAMVDGVLDPTADIDLVDEADEIAVFFQFMAQLGADESLFDIAQLIHTGQVEPQDKEQIAERVGVSLATVYRKMNRLGAMWREFEARVSSAAGGHLSMDE